MAERIIKNRSIDICTESFGSASNPSLLLIMGATASMIWWDEHFCRRMADSGYFVIRYDNRDTGKSTTYPPGVPPYTVLDLADDALAVLNGYDLQSAHLIGMSLGGMIAQIISIRNPDRVTTLTLVSSSVWDNLPELPQMEQKLLDYYALIPSIDWTDDQQVRKFIVGNWKNLNGSKHVFNDIRANELAAIEIQRASNNQSMFNHTMLGGGEEFYGKSRDIDKPVLIIHGTEDPVLPFAHAEALHETIRGSRLFGL